jgi:hypothetical protein
MRSRPGWTATPSRNFILPWRSSTSFDISGKHASRHPVRTDHQLAAIRVRGIFKSPVKANLIFGSSATAGRGAIKPVVLASGDKNGAASYVHMRVYILDQSPQPSDSARSLWHPPLWQDIRAPLWPKQSAAAEQKNARTGYFALVDLEGLNVAA